MKKKLFILFYLFISFLSINVNAESNIINTSIESKDYAILVGTDFFVLDEISLMENDISYFTYTYDTEKLHLCSAESKGSLFFALMNDFTDTQIICSFVKDSNYDSLYIIKYNLIATKSSAISIKKYNNYFYIMANEKEVLGEFTWKVNDVEYKSYNRFSYNLNENDTLSVEFNNYKAIYNGKIIKNDSLSLEFKIISIVFSVLLLCFLAYLIIKYILNGDYLKIFKNKTNKILKYLNKINEKEQLSLKDKKTFNYKITNTLHDLNSNAKLAQDKYANLSLEISSKIKTPKKVLNALIIIDDKLTNDEYKSIIDYFIKTFNDILNILISTDFKSSKNTVSDKIKELKKETIKNFEINKIDKEIIDAKNYLKSLNIID